MVLQDAAGDIRGPVAIPLRVEYWNGAAFETNADDSSSHFDGRNYCRQILYPQPDKGNSPAHQVSVMLTKALQVMKS
ncbi:hypothetical protein Q8W15_08985 [Photobacterium damselae subsp. piscicida]|nr:hypothetical protein [Photobacterium damselae subsp. piscicida]MDP2568783.1 hypothetical protein [Photobacterium damselae subsp. piscicida]